jgi:hypothetical protein
MALRFKRETKIVFIVLGLIIIGAAVFIIINYRKLKQPSPVSQNLATEAQVKSANVPVEPRGK